MPLKANEYLYSPIVLGEKSNQGVSLMDSMAEVIATAPKAIATSGSPQIAITTASAEATLATTAVQIMFKFFNWKPSFSCQGEFVLSNEQTGLVKAHHFL
jgi:hypothetical protein